MTARQAFQYALALGIAALLVWLSLRTLTANPEQDAASLLWETWQQSDKGWLLAMAGVGMVSHFLRAQRWRLLLQAAGQPVQTRSAFLSLMVGYLVNLAVPRGGEFSRCLSLQQLDRAPFDVSFGTVVVERLIDLVCLALVVSVAFVWEWEALTRFVHSLPAARWPVRTLVAAGVALLILLAGAIVLIRSSSRVRQAWEGFQRGLGSVRHMSEKRLFLVHTVLIWLLYFAMTACVLIAFPATRGMGGGAVLVVFAIGAIAMAAPLPGGAGSYHTLVPAGLVLLYPIETPSAVAFVFVFHAWQTLVMIVGGVVSLIASYYYIQWNRQTKRL